MNVFKKKLLIKNDNTKLHLCIKLEKLHCTPKNTRPFTNGMHCYENKKASEAALSLHRMFSIKFAKLLMQHPEFNNKKDSNHNIRNSKIFEEKEYAVTSSSSDSE